MPGGGRGAVSRSADPQAALLSELDRSVRWAERRARVVHHGGRARTWALGAAARAGMWLIEGLVLIGSPWAGVPVYGRGPARGAWRRRGADPDAADPG